MNIISRYFDLVYEAMESFFNLFRKSDVIENNIEEEDENNTGP